jgi:hypothetical protein
MGSDARTIVLCLLVPLAATALAVPFAEGGFVDDFSYIHMAKTLAQTGRFAYNGWPTAMLGVQVWWGAAWVWLCGFSFTLVRMSVLPFAAGAIALVYLLARRAGLTSQDSLFAALMTGLSTPYLPLVPTFMSDVPALFCLLGCWYGFARAAAPVAAGGVAWRAIAWLAVGMAAGLLGGTIRQAYWFAPVTSAAVLCLRRGPAAAVRIAAGACIVIGVATIALGAAWFNRQPYAIPTQLPAGAGLDVRVVAGGVAQIVAEAAQKVLPVVLFCLPWVVAHAATAARTRWGRCVLVAAAAMLAGVFIGTMTGSCAGPLSLLGGWWRPVGRPAHDALVGVIRCGVLGIVVALGMAVAEAVRRRCDSADRSRLPAAILMPLAFLVPYGCSLLMVAETTGGIYPRYYLPFLPALATWLLHHARPVPGAAAFAARRSVLGWALVGFFAVRGIAITHDEFADIRARLAAIAFLERQGVPRDTITSKWSIDGWEQVEREGHMNDRRIRVPPGGYRADVPHDYPDPQFRGCFPALRPDYVVAESRERVPGDVGDFPRFPYTAWLRPPQRREIVIRVHPPRDGTDGVEAGSAR